jgi:3-oxoacyl-[acyl-carrier protein] reductase
VAVVTGGAGGIGTAVCRALAAGGFTVAVGYASSAAEAAALAAQLASEDHGAFALPVTDSAALAAGAERVAARYGRCDLLVNCAGTTCFVPHADLDALDDQTIDAILSVNVRGAFAAVRAFRPMLQSSGLEGGGVVINISSTAAQSAIGSNVMYCASKAALDNMTRSLARALAPRIRVLSVSPGLVDTEFVQALDPAWRNEQAARTPLGRLSQPEEIARAVLAATTQLTFSTGSVLLVDGGRLLA